MIGNGISDCVDSTNNKMTKIYNILPNQYGEYAMYLNNFNVSSYC